MGAAMTGAAAEVRTFDNFGPGEDFEGEGWPKPSTTVNHLVRLYPVTRSTFEQLGVSLKWEGTDSLDEVAWHHGLENRELLGRLQEELHTGTGAPEGAQPVEQPGFQVRITRESNPDARPTRRQSLRFTYAGLALALIGFTHHTIVGSATPIDPLRPVRIYDQGSIKSLEQFSKETLRFITGAPRVGRMDAVEAVLAMTAQPEIWAQEPLIHLPKGDIRTVLGFGPATALASLAQVKRTPLLAELAPVILERAQRGDRLTRLEQDMLAVARRTWRLDGLLEQELQLVPPSQKGLEWLPILQPEGYDWGQQLSLKRRWSLVLQAVRMDQPERLRVDSQRLAWMLGNLSAATHAGSWWGSWSAVLEAWKRGVLPSGSRLVAACLF